MTAHSQHPEVPTPSVLEQAVERVSSGLERVIVLTGADGMAQAALVSLDELRKLDLVDALDNGAQHEEDDRAGLRLRESGEWAQESPETD